MEQQISHFKILDEIGSGGMGVVYRARDLRLRRKVALKVLPAGALAEPMIRERLMREAQTTSTLNHPHIVTVFEIHSAGDRDFIAMEFVEGKSLNHVIGEEGLPLEQALRYAIQIADGLACAHEHGVIHRDLKPQNVMITPSDDVKILDFGLAKRFLPAAASESSIEPGLATLTAPGVKVGTPAYMSPEQIESKRVDARSDVFSFGILLYQMLTGVSPFHRRNAILIFKAILSDRPEPLGTLKPKLPAELGRMLTQAVEKAPEDRYQSMRKLLVELEAVHAQLFGTGIYPVHSGAAAAPARPRSAVWRGWLLAVLAVAAAGLAGWWLSRPAGAPGLGAPGLGVPGLEDLGPIAGLHGAPRQATFAPGGDRVAFIDEDAAGVPQVWTRPLAGGAPIQVTAGDFPVERPQWSADAGSMVFGAAGGGVWLAAAEPGGAPRRLLERGSNPRLSPDGSRLAVELDGRIWTAGADGSDPAPLASVPPAFFARWAAMSPAFSPDGQSIAFFRPEAGASGDLWACALDGGALRRVVGKTFRGGDPTWTADGRRIVFWAELGGEAALWSVPAAGGEPARLTWGAGRHTGPAISAGGRLVYGSATPAFTLERRSAAGESLRLMPPGRREIVRPEVSPAGDRIAFSSPDGRLAGGFAAAADEHLFVVDAAGGRPLRITAGSGQRNLLPRWSADGSHLYFYQEVPAPSLRMIPAAGGDSVVVLDDWPWRLRYDSAVGPAGERVVYLPIADGEPQPLTVRDLASGEERQLGAVLLVPRWSPDGGLVLGADGDDRIHLCPVSGGDCRFLAEGFAPRWGPEGDTITFARRAGQAARTRPAPASIWTLPLDGGPERRLAEVGATAPLSFGFGLLANGDLFWNRRIPGSRELWLADLR